jgi:RNA polymerase sigma-70 factor (ECF subfamily)
MFPSLAMRPLQSGVGTTAPGASPWLRRFHDGDRKVIEELYREHFGTVGRAVGPVLGAADRETVVHEIFLRLLTQPALRTSFRDGDLGAWLTVIARNHAIDFTRRRNREILAGTAVEVPASGAADSGEAGAHARVLVERFRKDVLPPKWSGVFEARFIRQLNQPEAAAALGIGRTTLAYQEARVRRLLRRFLLRRR